MHSISLNKLFTSVPPSKNLGQTGFKRSIYKLGNAKLQVDKLDDIECAFIRLDLNTIAELSCDSGYMFESVAAGGYLGKPLQPDQPYLWLPLLPVNRQVNSKNSILDEQTASLHTVCSGQDNGFSVQLEASEASVTDIVIIRFSATFPINQISTISTLEIQGYFLWGSHGCVNRPADLYQNLIHGAIYDLRYSWPDNKKCFSENEAHALYTIFSGLEKNTGKSIYRFLQLQIVLSIIQRQADDGGWYHGIWTDSSECHYRLHTSALHLLMDEYQRSEESEIKQALEKGTRFLSKTTDTLDCGIWFLHDSLELSVESMNKGPFNWINSNFLGKSSSNMLVLNTHLDSTIAINRYQTITGDTQYNELIASALQSTRTILSLKPAEWLYKPLFWAIGLTMLPTEIASKLPAPIRVIKRISWQYLIKKLPDIKARFPRLVMPNGYIDRELSLRTWALDYQTINLMDLARHARAFPGGFDEPTLDKAMEFTYTSGLIKRYRELTPGKRYSVGFWAEALYHRCLAKNDLKYRQWLAEAMLECHQLDFGIAPSLLGTNGEALGHYSQTDSSDLYTGQLTMANLSCHDRIEIMLVNCSDQEHRLNSLPTPYKDLKWFNATGAELTINQLHVSANNWIRGINS